MCHRPVGLANEDLEEQLLGAGVVLLNRSTEPLCSLDSQDPRNPDPGVNRMLVDFERSPEDLQSLLRVFPRKWAGPQSPAAHDEVARIGIDAPFFPDLPSRCLYDFQVQCSRETARDLVLSLREIGAIGVEAVGPDVGAALRIDQLNVYPNLIARPPHAPFEDIADAELAADLLRVDGFSLVGECRIAGDHEASGNL